MIRRTPPVVPPLADEVLHGPAPGGDPSAFSTAVLGLAAGNPDDLYTLLALAGRFEALLPDAWVWAAANRVPFAPPTLTRLADLADVAPYVASDCRAIQALHASGLPMPVVDLMAVHVAVDALEVAEEPERVHQLLRIWSAGVLYVEALVHRKVRRAHWAFQRHLARKEGFDVPA